MDKIKINNQIVQMRKYVKQAKVHVINKFVKEVKLLQNRKGDENKVSKAKRKAERLLTEIALIKKMKPDSISKLAISKALDWNSVLQQKNASIEDRCISMLANYKPVQEEVENFYASNKELISKIPECLKEWEEKTKTQNEEPPKQSVKASDLRQRKKERKSKLNKSPRKLSNGKRFLQVDDELLSQNSDPALPKTDCLLSASFEEQERSSTVDGDSNICSNAENEKSNKIISEQNENVPEVIDSLGSNSDLQKLYVRNAKSETSPSASSSSDTDDDIGNDSSAFQNDKDSSSNEMVGESSTIAAIVTKSSNQENENELLLKNAAKKNVVYNMNRIDNFQNSESKMLSDTIDTEHTKHSPVKKRCTISPEKTKQTGSNKSHNLKAIKQLNLEELKDLDEIPVLDSSVNEHSDIEPESSEESDVENPEEQESDSFFLREGESVSDVKTDTKRPLKNGLFEASRSVRRLGLQNNYLNSHSSSEKYSSKQEFNKRRNFSSDSKMPQNFKFKYENTKHDSRWTPKRKFSQTDQLDISPKRGMYQNKNVKNGSKIFMKDREASFQEQIYTNSKDKRKSNAKKEKLSESLPIHPSWEAKRKLKESKNVQFQGKRMVFND
ncbi:serum response factor-binding protein 1-like [Uloborus diversus]|uniref:serum response factor-binding protein 1-like n=1 Tax=Uloborus diversus TaxID=327109 RepID=UPI00240A4DBE|nr:serum response factor-binding protein 1-like [Uloborus diversus]